jgi:hypothetical protein
MTGDQLTLDLSRPCRRRARPLHPSLQPWAWLTLGEIAADLYHAHDFCPCPRCADWRSRAIGRVTVMDNNGSRERKGGRCCSAKRQA